MLPVGRHTLWACAKTGDACLDALACSSGHVLFTTNGPNLRQMSSAVLCDLHIRPLWDSLTARMEECVEVEHKRVDFRPPFSSRDKGEGSCEI